MCLALGLRQDRGCDGDNTPSQCGLLICEWITRQYSHPSAVQAGEAWLELLKVTACGYMPQLGGQLLWS